MRKPVYKNILVIFSAVVMTAALFGVISGCMLLVELSSFALTEVGKAKMKDLRQTDISVVKSTETTISRTFELEPPKSVTLETRPVRTAIIKMLSRRRRLKQELTRNISEPEFWFSQMKLIPSGCYLMGRAAGEPSTPADATPARYVCLSQFYLDVYETTVAEFRLCVDDGACTTPVSGSFCNWKKRGREEHPINCVHWWQAQSYCQWALKRLPTEAEWEFAARGRNNRPYPWGDQKPGCDFAVINNGCGRYSTLPIGSKPTGAGPFGIYDMVGNVAEWVADWYDDRLYTPGPYINPLGPTEGVFRVFRGGSWRDGSESASSYHRSAGDPLFYSEKTIGFRCAADVDDISRLTKPISPTVEREPYDLTIPQAAGFNHLGAY